MTREENLHWIDQEIQTWENECQSKHPIKEALYAARKALEQEPCEDAVSRTEVLNLVRFNAFHVKSQIKAIENMPSVTPQEPILEKDGTLIVTTEHCEKVGRVLVQYGTNGTLFYQDQELRKGHWIEHPHECGINWEYPMYECSECHGWTEDDSDFCPNCGVDMREVKE